MCVYILQIPTLNYTVYAISTLVEQSHSLCKKDCSPYPRAKATWACSSLFCHAKILDCIGIDELLNLSTSLSRFMDLT